jgi:hypothetical protein
MRTGMEPFFEFIAKVRYAVRMCGIERANWKRYRETV